MSYLPHRKVMSLCIPVLCDSRYVGRTSHRLEDRIRLHVLKWIQSKVNTTRTPFLRSNKKRTAQPYCDTATGKHLFKNKNVLRTTNTPCSQLQQLDFHGFNCDFWRQSLYSLRNYSMIFINCYEKLL